MWLLAYMNVLAQPSTHCVPYLHTVISLSPPLRVPQPQEIPRTTQARQRAQAHAAAASAAAHTQQSAGATDTSSVLSSFIKQHAQEKQITQNAPQLARPAPISHRPHQAHAGEKRRSVGHGVKNHQQQSEDASGLG